MKVKEISDKVQFIFHRGILGVVYWMVFSSIIAFQQFIKIQFIHKNFGIILIGVLLTFLP